MRKLLATTSLSLVFAGAAFAQSATTQGTTTTGAEAQSENFLTETANDVTEAGKDAQQYLKKKSSQAGKAIEETWDKTKAVTAEAYDATKDAADDVADNVSDAYAEVTEEMEAIVADATDEDLVIVSPEGVAASELAGQPVYDINNNRIGEVARVETGKAGKVKAATIEIGGFLGIGETEVAVDVLEMGFLRAEDADLRVYVTATEQELEQRAELQNS
ncbi:PRC-barrel domain-containing protein [Shimia sp. SDUM112013]|uniref:PRC-barrel domain-containing protein n=1 Tax=Shimia sp. SDUM112013 TaxID=3136160 RepID=UPI0032EC17D6